MIATLDAWPWWTVTALLTASVQGAVTVAIVWLVCRCVPAISASMRSLLWWVAALAFVVALMPLPSVRIPLLPRPAPMVSIPIAPGHASPAGTPLRSRAGSVITPRASRTDGGIRLWVIAAITLWIAGLVIQAVRLGHAYVRLRGVLHRSTMVREEVLGVASRIADALRLRRVPLIRMSEEIESPLVAGLVRPIVLLPAAATAILSSEELAMAMGHELAHVRRRDLLFAWAPALAERLFFFHPLARLAAREYAAARESACDALVLDAMGIAPQEYGRMLVRLGVGVNPVFTVGGSSPSLASLRRRLDMLEDASSNRSSRAMVALVVLTAIVAVLPFRVVARTPASAQTPASTAPPETAQAPTKPAPAARPQSAAPAPGTAPAAAPSSPARSAGLEQAIAEQRRNMQQIEAALGKLRADLQALYAQQRDSQMAQERQQAEAVRRLYEEAQSARRRQEMTVVESQVQTTNQFLENQLRLLTAEHEQTSLRLRALSAEIDAIRQKLDEARRAQEIESAQKKGEEKK